MSPYPIKDWDFKNFKDGQDILNAINRSFFHLEDALHECLLSTKPCSDGLCYTNTLLPVFFIFVPFNIEMLLCSGMVDRESHGIPGSLPYLSSRPK